MAILDDPELAANGQPPLVEDDPAAGGWKRNKAGRWYAPARGRSGVVYRQGNETVEEAHALDAKGAKQRRPKSKPKAPKPPAPTQQSLKELEYALAEAFKAPAVLAAANGDEWAAMHFTSRGPLLARNLIAAAEHNPWLRAKLEAALVGDVFIIKLITSFGVASALVMYALPPMIYYLDPPFVPDKAREMFDVPHRSKDDGAEAAADPAPTETAVAA